jgi:hypothetical protein
MPYALGLLRCMAWTGQAAGAAGAGQQPCRGRGGPGFVCWARLTALYDLLYLSFRLSSAR